MNYRKIPSGSLLLLSAFIILMMNMASFDRIKAESSVSFSDSNTGRFTTSSTYPATNAADDASLVDEDETNETKSHGKAITSFVTNSIFNPILKTIFLPTSIGFSQVVNSYNLPLYLLIRLLRV
jgi:hypothetical protein